MEGLSPQDSESTMPSVSASILKLSWISAMEAPWELKARLSVSKVSEMSATGLPITLLKMAES